ncbi:MAG: hypothetical protein FJW27_18865 [Acidimicrobiia bacterium]|nr:hypothetical protein [Acidimicrobiia bacterium]
MHFAAPFPVWLVVLIVVAVVAIAVVAYRRPLVPLSSSRRLTLAALRALALASLAFFLARPTTLSPPTEPRDLVVPVLVDTSRSMRVTDGEGGVSRIDVATRLLTDQLLPALSQRLTPEVFAFGETVGGTSADGLSADARHSDIHGSVATIADRYRGRSLAGVVLLSDGGDTESSGRSERNTSAIPVYSIGIGSTSSTPDREVVGVAVGDPRLDAATVDLRVTAVSRGFNKEPFQLRLLADGRVIETRLLTPVADGSPIDATFTVPPNDVSPTVYTVEIDPDRDAIAENNQRSVLVSPAGRKRRVMAIFGSPGFDHSFLARALAADSGLELDMIVQKGRNDAGQDTFFVQAGGHRAAGLASGFPATREALFAYDALIVANVEADFFKRAQLQMVADFVSERGGGLLVFGGRSFTQRGLLGTPIEEVLPVELNDRRGRLARASLDIDSTPKHHGVTLTVDGETHAIMRLGETADHTRRKWSALPALASAAALGGPRPGATVLAVTSTAGGVVVPLVAVQRYGRGRSMLFAGEAAWRWRMLMPATDRSYEFFWRQALRWLSIAAPDPVDVSVPEAAEPGDTVAFGVEVRDAAFRPVADAIVATMLTTPGGGLQSLTTQRDTGGAGRFTATVRPEQPGLYRFRTEARRGSTELGSSERWFHVGGADREFADPRLNEGVLSRLARASGGRYFEVGEATQMVGLLESAAPATAAPEPRDVWHAPWAIGLLMALLSTEWILRRLWGLR